MFYNHYIEFEKLGRIETIKICNDPPVIYRFLGADYVPDLMNKGKLQIKHQGSYREQECGNRKDVLDGKSSVILPFGTGNVHTVVAMDAYILCFSCNPYKFLANKFADKEKPSVCIKITRPKAFMYELDQLVRNYLHGIRSEVNASVADQVLYYDPNTLNPEHNAIDQWPVVMRKPMGKNDNPFYYAQECEYRVVWDLATRNASRQPINIESISLAEYVEVVPENELIELEIGAPNKFRSLI